jgi:tRNA pseudouridine32 synthase / 23S rRNA pseudouridine746 synthase
LPNNIKIIYQHDDFIAVNKPSGIDFHDSEDSIGFFNSVQEQRQQNLFPVHRLDKVTSGVLLFATNKSAAARFELLFRHKNMTKYYLAIADGKPKKKQGWVKGDMQVSRRGQYKLMRTMKNPAITYFESSDLGSGQRGYFLQPKTGKTHQLRVAMKSIGAPILGDMMYGQSIQMSQYDRCYLHAFAIQFSEFGDNHLITTSPTDGALYKQATCLEWQIRLLKKIHDNANH